MDALLRGTPVEHTARDTNAVATAYAAGYADGLTLLHVGGHNQSSMEPLHRIHARYLGYIELKHPTAEARTYIAGFRDAAADNLPCPPQALEPEVHRLAA